MYNIIIIRGGYIYIIHLILQAALTVVYKSVYFLATDFIK
jgi:hypothetical protein